MDAIEERLPDLSDVVVLSVGASFEMLAGVRWRAPEWIQRIGMEWFVRFLQEPRRLFRRYFIEDVAFFGLIWREWRRTRPKQSRG
jgi:N-acetylglucosaminyldiphosphoundecaprenol N-acetyl-beta-D-mannosaminyltransferase